MRGIYLITVDRGVGEPPYFYVGQAVEISGRRRNHLYFLRRGQHRTRRLQRCYDKYGEAALSWSVLEQVARVEDLQTREAHWYQAYLTEYGTQRVLNSSVPSDNPMHTEQVRERHAEAMRRRSEDAEWRAEHSERTRQTRAKRYVFLSPWGERIDVYNLRSFCLEHGLTPSRMCEVASGKHSHHKEWRRYD